MNFYSHCGILVRMGEYIQGAREHRVYEAYQTKKGNFR